MVEAVMRRMAICLLAVGAGAMGVAGAAIAPARAQAGSSAVQLSQGVAPPTVAATQEPRADGSGASASALSAPSPEGASASPSYGFDACATPSQRAMNAWAKSPYRSIGVYIGGVNRACAQPNLTTAWVGAQVAAGWQLIPTYVGLQSPTSGCTSCAKLRVAKATAQGEEAAEDAVADAQSVGMGQGTPIYFDMEGYARTASSTRATLAFLEAWTRKLHGLGYVSGVYSSSASGIADLESRLGSGYPEPDDIWIADWNGRADTEEAFLPSYAWAPHRRLHQYRGGHNETYGGVTINIDNDYVDGAAFGNATAPPPLSVSRVTASGATVSVTVACGWSPETSCPGQILLRTHILVPVQGARRTGLTRSVRVGVGRRAFHLVGGHSHAFRVALNARGRSLLRARRRMRAQLLVAIPGARVARRISLTSLR
ncbi:MAG TPA: DUF1906 domain-containing protein [Solirubrobacterales bacterium]|nr:DUF1906 domain-containing protein [Solirubrobacterales bacterium]